MNIFDAPKGRLDLTIAPKQVTNDKANLEATRSKQEAAFRSLPGDDQLSQKNRDSKRRMQSLSTPISIKKKSIESTPLTGGEYHFDYTVDTGFRPNPVVQPAGWDPSVTALKLASAFLAPVDNPVKHEENDKVAFAGPLARFGRLTSFGRKAIPSAGKVEGMQRVAGGVRGGIVGNEAGRSIGETAEDNLMLKEPGKALETADNMAAGGTVGGALMGVAAPNRFSVGRIATGGALINKAERAHSGKSFTQQYAPRAARWVHDKFKGDDTSLLDVRDQFHAGEDIDVPKLVNQVPKSIRPTVQKVINKYGPAVQEVAAPVQDMASKVTNSAPVAEGMTDVADLSKRVGRGVLPVASAAYQGASRLGGAGIASLLNLIRANASRQSGGSVAEAAQRGSADSLASVPGLAPRQ